MKSLITIFIILITVGCTSPLQQSYLNRGLSEEQAQPWIEKKIGASFAKSYVDNNITPDQAGEWYKQRILGQYAKSYMKNKIPPDQAGLWYRAGIESDFAKKLIDAGVPARSGTAGKKVLNGLLAYACGLYTIDHPLATPQPKDKNLCFNAEEIILLNQKKVDGGTVRKYFDAAGLALGKSERGGKMTYRQKMKRDHAILVKVYGMIRPKNIVELHDNKVLPDQYLYYVNNGLKDTKEIISAAKEGYNNFNFYVKNENGKFVKKAIMSITDTSDFYGQKLSSKSSASELKTQLNKIIRIVNRDDAFNVSVVEFFKREPEDLNAFIKGWQTIWGDKSDAKKAEYGEIFPYHIRLKVSLKPIYFIKLSELVDDIKIKKNQVLGDQPNSKNGICYGDKQKNVYLIGKYIGVDGGQPSDWSDHSQERVQDNDLQRVRDQLQNQVTNDYTYRSFQYRSQKYSNLYSNPYVEFKGAYTLTNVHSNVLRDLFKNMINKQDRNRNKDTYKLKFMDKNQREIQINNLSVGWLRLERAGTFSFGKSDGLWANIGYHSLGTIHNWSNKFRQYRHGHTLKTRYLFDIYENLDGCSNANGFLKTSTQSTHQVVWLTEIEANSINEIRASKTKIKLD